jgi:hypothetical protein
MQGFDVAVVSIVIACVSIVVATILAVLQLRNWSRTRQAQLFMELYEQFYTPEFHRRWMETVYILQDEDLFDSDGVPTFLKGEIETFVETTAICSFFEGIGVLVNRKLIDIVLVAELMSTPILFVWERISKNVEHTREILGRPQIYEWFEYLYREIQRLPSQISQQPIQKPPNP